MTDLIDTILSHYESSETTVNGPSRALAWARVSSDMQDDRGSTVRQQLAEISEYAGRRGIEIVEEFSETGSAYSNYDKRVRFHEMLDRAKADPEINAIIVHDLSRFSRDSVVGATELRSLRETGVTVISVTDPDIDPETSAGVYVEKILLAKNEVYSMDIAMHTRKGCRANAQTRDAETGWYYWNGGQPVWGYRIEHLDRGKDRSGKPIIKSIVVPDDTIVNGKPVHEWARHCLEELAAKGASLVALRDFCNDNHLPARRSKYWGTSSWSSLLQPYVLLTYNGYGIWNVHKKNGKKRPSSEWVIVPNAHEPLISEDSVVAIQRNRAEKRAKYSFDKGYGKSRTSRYILSGGLFRCDRCGQNMIGHNTNKGTWYICGSQPYRKGMGCGPGVYVPIAFIEDCVVDGIRQRASSVASHTELVKQLNLKLRHIWEKSNGYDPHADRKLREIDRKIANIRQSIEDGLAADLHFFSKRLAELHAEKQGLLMATLTISEPPQVVPRLAEQYLKELDETIACGDKASQKRLVRLAVEDIKLAPDDLNVEITYKLPEPIMNSDIAGGGFEPPTSGL